MTKLMIALAALAVIATFDAVAEEPVPAETAQELLAHFEPEMGRWAVSNSVMKGPGQVAELKFIVETSQTLGGLGVTTDWYDAETGNFFGEVIRTYNPKTEEVEQHYFAAASSTWSMTSQALVFSGAGYSTSFSGEDPYGTFDARTQTTHLPDHGGYDWTIERRYGEGDWFVIDRGEARPLPAGD